MTGLSPQRRWGHLAGFGLALANAGLPVLISGSEETGPPLPVVVFSVVAGLMCLGLLAWSWVKNAHGPRRAAAVLMTLAAISAMPAFLVGDVPALLQIAAGLYVLATILTIVLLFYPDRTEGGAATEDLGGEQRLQRRGT